MPQTNPLDFSTPAGAEKALKQVSQLMGRAGQAVVTAEFSDKPKRTSGVTYREAYLTLASGQQVTLRVNATGDIYQVLLNNQMQPLKEHTDTAKAVGEIAALAEKNQAAFQKAQARKAVALPKGMSTPKPKMVERLKQQVAELDTQLTERRATLADLQAKLGDGAMTDSTGSVKELSGAAIDTLMALGRRGPLEDGDVPSKSGRDELVALGYVDRYTDEGDNVLTASGTAALRMLDSAKPRTVTMPIDPLPLAGAYVAARELGKDQGQMLDSAATAGAADWLRIGLDVVENNGPISLENGDLEQARHQMHMACSFRAALAMLDSASSMTDASLEQLVAIAQADAVDEDGITSQEALAPLLSGGLVDADVGLYFLTDKGRACLNDAGYDAYGEPFAAGSE